MHQYRSRGKVPCRGSRTLPFACSATPFQYDASGLQDRPNAVKGFENLPAIVEDYIHKVRLEKYRLDERDLPLIPSPSCILEEFKTIALTTHHPYIRGEKSRDWIRQNQILVILLMEHHPLEQFHLEKDIKLFLSMGILERGIGYLSKVVLFLDL